MPDRKPFRGIIKDWRVTSMGNLHGTCVIHTTYQHGIEDGKPITTSCVVALGTRDGLTWCETQNSVYLLL